MNESQAWRAIAEQYATQADYSLWLRAYDLYLDRNIDNFTYRTMCVRIESHLKASVKPNRWCPPINGCLVALFLEPESAE